MLLTSLLNNQNILYIKFSKFDIKKNNIKPAISKNSAKYGRSIKPRATQDSHLHGSVRHTWLATAGRHRLASPRKNKARDSRARTATGPHSTRQIKARTSLTCACEKRKEVAGKRERASRYQVTAENKLNPERRFSRNFRGGEPSTRVWSIKRTPTHCPRKRAATKFSR